MDAQALIELCVLLGENHREVGVAAPQIIQLLQHTLRQGIGDGGNGQGDEHLVGMEAGVVMPQVLDFHVADGSDDGGRQQVQILVNAPQKLDGIEQHGGGGPQQ